MNVLRRLTEPALKRFYKFVVKKLVGRFLQDDLLLEQLDVHLRAGTVELSNFALDCKALTQLASASNSHFAVASASIRKLRITIAYANLLSESLTVQVEGIRVEVVPAGDGAGRTGAPPRPGGPGGAPSSHAKSSATHAQPPAAAEGLQPLPESVAGTEEALEGLDFVASWIEQVASRVKVSVRDVAIRVKGGADTSGSAVGGAASPEAGMLLMQLSSMDFCDETPQHMTAVPTRATGAAAGVAQPSYVPPCVAYKRLTVGPVEVGLEGVAVLGRTVGSSSVRVSYDCSGRAGGDTGGGAGQHSQSPLIDVDVTVKKVEVRLCPGILAYQPLHRLAHAYSRPGGAAAHAASAVDMGASMLLSDMLTSDALVQRNLFREAFWYLGPAGGAGGLAGTDGDTAAGTGDIDLETLEALLQRYAAARARLARQMGLADDTGLPHYGDGDESAYFDAQESHMQQAAASVLAGTSFGPPDTCTPVLNARLRLLDVGVCVFYTHQLVPAHDLSSSVSARASTPWLPGQDPPADHLLLSIQHTAFMLHKSGGRGHGSDATHGFEIGSLCLLERLVPEAPSGGLLAPLPAPPRLASGMPLLQFIKPSPAAPCAKMQDADLHGHVEVSCTPLEVDLSLATLKRILSLSAAYHATPAKTEGAAAAGGADAPTRAPGRKGDYAIDTGAPPQLRAHLPKVSICITLTNHIPSATAAAGAAAPEPSHTKSQAYLLQRALDSERDRWEQLGPPTSHAPLPAVGARTSLHLELSPVFVTAVGPHGGATAPTVTVATSSCTVAMAFPHPRGSGGVLRRQFLFAGGKAGPSAASEGMTLLLGGTKEASSSDANAPPQSGLQDASGDRTGVLYAAWEDEGAEASARPNTPPTIPNPDDTPAAPGQREHYSQHQHHLQAVKLTIPLLRIDLSAIDLRLLATMAQCIGAAGLGSSTNSGAGPHPQQMRQQQQQQQACGTASAQFVLEVAELSTMLHESTLAQREQVHQGEAKPPPLTSFYIAVAQLRAALGGAGGGLVGLSVQDFTVSEKAEGRRRGSDVTVPVGLPRSCADTSSRLGTMRITPVVYRTKWSGQAQSPSLSMRLSGFGSDAITAVLDLSHVTLRYRVESRWLVRLVALLADPLPSDEAPSQHTTSAGDSKGTSMITKVFVTVHNAAVDLCTGDHKCGRGVLSLRMFRLSANLVPEASMQGFKMVARDAALHCSPNPTDYSAEDATLCGVAVTPISGLLSGGASRAADASEARARLLAHNDHEYLEKRGFAKIATLDFTDAFIRTRVHPASLTDAYTLVELWMGSLRVYTCCDSLITTSNLLARWWQLYQEHFIQPAALAAARAAALQAQAAAALAQATATAAAARPLRNHLSAEEASSHKGAMAAAGSTSSGVAAGVAVPAFNLLEGIDEDAFGPSFAPEPPTYIASPAQTVTPPRPVLPQPKLASPALVIEDYYCLSIQTQQLQAQHTPTPTSPVTVSSPPPAHQHEAAASMGEDSALQQQQQQQQTAADRHGRGSGLGEEEAARWFQPGMPFGTGSAFSQFGAATGSALVQQMEPDSDSDSEGASVFGHMPVTGTYSTVGHFGLGMFSLPRPIDIELEALDAPSTLGQALQQQALPEQQHHQQQAQLEAPSPHPLDGGLDPHFSDLLLFSGEPSCRASEAGARLAQQASADWGAGSASNGSLGLGRPAQVVPLDALSTPSLDWLSGAHLHAQESLGGPGLLHPLEQPYHLGGDLAGGASTHAPMAASASAVAAASDRSQALQQQVRPSRSMPLLGAASPAPFQRSTSMQHHNGDGHLQQQERGAATELLQPAGTEGAAFTTLPFAQSVHSGSDLASSTGGFGPGLAASNSSMEPALAVHPDPASPGVSARPPPLPLFDQPVPADGQGVSWWGTEVPAAHCLGNEAQHGGACNQRHDAHGGDSSSGSSNSDGSPMSPRSSISASSGGVGAGSSVANDGRLQPVPQDFGSATEAGAPATSGGAAAKSWQNNLLPHQECQAFWYAADPSTEEGGSATSSGTTNLKVFPHHMPIPPRMDATAGAKERAQGIGAAADMAPPAVNGQHVAASIVLHSLNVCWRLFAGNDWAVPAAPTAAPAQVAALKAAPASAGGSMGADPDSTGSGAADGNNKKSTLLDALLENYQDSVSAQDNLRGGLHLAGATYVARQHQGHSQQSGAAAAGHRPSGRKTSQMVEVSLHTVTLRLQQYHPPVQGFMQDAGLLSNTALSVRDLCVCDTLTSRRPRKTLAHWRSDDSHPRECHQCMVTVQLTARSPGTQPTIIAAGQKASAAGSSSPQSPPALVIGDEYMLRVRLLPLHVSFGQHTIDFLAAFVPPPPAAAKPADAPNLNMPGAASTACEEADAEADAAMSLFLQSIDIGPFKLRIDYQPRLINLRSLQGGAYLELLNLFPLEGVGLQVERVQLSGVTGFAVVANACLESWVRDVTGSQLHKFLAGTAAVRPLVNVGRGVADLVLVPLKQYKRDGKILRGIRKGTVQCAGRVLAETLNTSYKLVRYVSRTLDDIVTPSTCEGGRASQCYDVQPRGVMDSLEQAYVSLSREVFSAAHTIVAIPYEEREELGGYARTVIRALPIAVLRPVIGATEAVSFALLGFRNTLQPDKKKEEEAQWQ